MLEALRTMMKEVPQPVNVRLDGIDKRLDYWQSG